MKKLLFSQAQINYAADLAAEMWREKDRKLTHRENLVHSLRIRSNDPEAEQTVDRLLGGLECFRDQHRILGGQAPDRIISDYLENVSKDLPEEVQRDYLMQILAFAFKVNGRTAPAESNSTIQDLRDKVTNCLCEYSMANILPPADSNPFAAIDKEAAETLAEQLEDAVCADYLALSLYIGKGRGRLYQIPADMPPEEIGAITAATVAVHQCFLEHVLDRINWEVLLRALKVIAAVTVVVLGTVAAWYIDSAVVSWAVMFSEKVLLNLGTVGVLVSAFGLTALLLAMCLAYIMPVGFFIDDTKLVEELSAAWNWVREKLHLQTHESRMVTAYEEDELWPGDVRFRAMEDEPVYT